MVASRRPGRGAKGPRSSPPPEPSARRRRTPEQAREVILQAAEPLLVEQGPDRVGLQAVARAAGVSHALVTHYFGTYEALVREVIVRRNALLAEEFRKRLLDSEVPPGPEQLLERFFSVIREGGHVRLLAWALLSGRAEHLPTPRVEGLRLWVDAMELQTGRLATEQGQPRPSREALEMTLLVGICASQWYALARPMLLPALGREPDALADAQFRAVLGAMLHGALGLTLPTGG